MNGSVCRSSTGPTSAHISKWAFLGDLKQSVISMARKSGDLQWAPAHPMCSIMPECHCSFTIVVTFGCVFVCLRSSTSLKMCPKFIILPSVLPMSSVLRVQKVCKQSVQCAKVARIYIYTYIKLAIEKWLMQFSGPDLCISKLYKWDPRIFN